MRNASRLALSAGSAATMVAVTIIGAPSVSAAPQPRVSPSQCGFDAPKNGYVIVDPSTNTKCVTNRNGTYMWVKGASIRRCQSSLFIASFRVIPRGDVKPFVTFKFIRGKLVVTKRVKIRAGQKAAVLFPFKRNGRWTVVASFKGKRVTSTVNVRPGAKCSWNY